MQSSGRFMGVRPGSGREPAAKQLEYLNGNNLM
jgi:hypothetical protein